MAGDTPIATTSSVLKLLTPQGCILSLWTRLVVFQLIILIPIGLQDYFNIILTSFIKFAFWRHLHGGRYWHYITTRFIFFEPHISMHQPALTRNRLPGISFWNQLTIVSGEILSLAHWVSINVVNVVTSLRNMWSSVLPLPGYMLWLLLDLERSLATSLYRI
jgi:hypothetical protein